jgi:hypothetical protein
MRASPEPERTIRTWVPQPEYNEAICGSVYKQAAAAENHAAFRRASIEMRLISVASILPGLRSGDKLKSTEADRRAYLRVILVLVFQLATITCRPLSL